MVYTSMKYIITYARSILLRSKTLCSEEFKKRADNRASRQGGSLPFLHWPADSLLQ